MKCSDTRRISDKRQKNAYRVLMREHTRPLNVRASPKRSSCCLTLRNENITRHHYWPDLDPSRNAFTPEPLYVDPVSETQSGGTTHSPSNCSAVEIQQPLTDTLCKIP